MKFNRVYNPKQRYKRRRNCLDRITIEYSCHTTDRSNSSRYMEKIFTSQDIFPKFGMDYCR